MMDQESHISSQILEFSNANIKTIQSANTLFKFMKKFDYLQSIIEDKINVFCDERSEDIKFTFSIHETDDVHEKLKLYIFYNNLMTGDIKYENKKIFPDNIKNEPIDEQLIKTLS